jgi:hypothetical protein
VGNEVYANGREVSCKAANGKSICAFPDVCLTPPPPPAGPLPIPYPNTGMASDTDGGSSTVKIGGEMVMLKDSSCFKSSAGDEAATKSQGMNVVTHQIQGKCYFTSWSMDVKIEGENAVRHMDMLTHNHGSAPGGTPPWVYQDMPAAQRDICEAQDQDAKDKCAGATPHVEDGEQKGLDCPPGCEEAKACILAKKKHDKEYCCSPNTTGHHLVEVHCFTHPAGRGEAAGGGWKLDEYLDYEENEAPCVCASESASSGSHFTMHDIQGRMERGYMALREADPGYSPHVFGGHPNDVSYWNYGEARDAGVAAHHAAFPHCNQECTAKQLDAYHQDDPRGPGCTDESPMRTDPVNRH